jgi:alpha-tubulin suppressor-like RCC1 family protein
MRAKVLMIALIVVGCGDITESMLPVEPPPVQADFVVPDKVTSISAIWRSTCTVVVDGTVNCYGLNASGQSPASVTPSTSKFTQVVEGSEFGCALREDAGVECWGSNVYGQAVTPRSATVGSFTELTAGHAWACGLRTDGAVECWGTNNSNQAPAERTAATGTFVQVAGGLRQTCALRTDGNLECWGNNINDATVAPDPSPSTFIHVAMGNDSGCAVRADGVIECWGRNADSESPSEKTPLASRFVEVDKGANHACAVRADGVVECWGSDSHGQAPATKTATGGRFVSVTAGEYYSCGLTNLGAMQCWGDNTYGQAPALLQAAQAAATAFTATFLSTTQALIGWTDNSSNEGYWTVQRRDFNVATWEYEAWDVVAKLPANYTAFVDPTLSADSRYQYRVRPCGAAGCATWLTGAYITNATLPTKPSGLIANAGPMVSLQWTDQSSNELNFEVRRRTYDFGTSTWSAWEVRARTVPNGSGYADVVMLGSRYQYSVRACNAAGCSAGISKVVDTI